MLLRPLAASLAAVLIAACGSTTEPQPAVPIVSATPEEPPGPQAEDFATIDILCEPPTPVLVDGKPAGTSPIKGFKVPPGRHDVTFADPENGNRTMTVDLQPGEGKTVKSDRPIIERRENAPPPKKK